jgi:hypothetical protein
MLEVIQAQYVHDYTIRLAFNDGCQGLVDLADHLWGTVFEPLRDINKFKAFNLSKTLHTIQWPNDADFAPEFLKDKLIEQ